MIHNFNEMFDGESKIKHFDIGISTIGLDCYADDIKEKYNDEIQKELILWIKKEVDANKLFQEKNWKPFRDPWLLTDMFLGYKKMFRYDKYYLQLSLLIDCELDYDICTYCNTDGDRTHFALTLHGWKDDEDVKLQPYNYYNILDDNLVPESVWMYGSGFS